MSTHEKVLASKDGWFEMDSAPLDGSLVLLFCPGSYSPKDDPRFIGYFFRGKKMRGQNEIPPTWRAVGGAIIQPQRWRPMPDLPKME